MSVNDRIEKFASDALLYLASKKESKILSEIKGLSVYITKHQNEAATPNAQTKLLEVVQNYFLYCKSSEGETLLNSLEALLQRYT
jgi:hypothetical protein